MTTYNCAHPPSLTFSKIQQASIGNCDVEDWNPFFVKAISMACVMGVSREKIVELSGATLVKGKPGKRGYYSVSGSPLYVLNMSANKAFYIGYTIAKLIGVEFQIQFRWKKSDGAEHPGEVGLLEFYALIAR